MDTIWTPDLAGRARPRYRAIADALEADIEAGTLPGGTRLPTHRALADRLGVTVGTVSRAYAEAERRGLVDATVGRGTFVRAGDEPDAGPAFPALDETAAAKGDPGLAPAGLADLSTNTPASGPAREALEAIWSRFRDAGRLDTIALYQGATGNPEHRVAAADWLTRTGLHVGGDDIVLVAGGQTGQALTLGLLCPPGEHVLLGALTWAVVKDTLRLHHLRAAPVAVDGEGLRPDALADACRRTGARTVFTMPTLSNPTTATMGETRRRDILAVAREHGLTIIEDDVYGFLHAGRHTPLAALDRDHVVHVTSLSKAVAPGIRAGMVVPPPRLRRKLVAAVRATMLMTSPLDLEYARIAIETGIADRAARAQVQEAQARQALLRQRLGHLDLDTDPAAFHAWLRLPDGWTTAAFTRALEARGVLLAPGDGFAVEDAPGAVRICLCTAPDRETLARALDEIAALADTPPATAFPVV